VIDTGSPAHVAGEIEVSEQLLGRWVAQERAPGMMTSGIRSR
jgi:hypothetical protein